VRAAAVNALAIAPDIKPSVIRLNATGAIGAIASELGIPWRVCRGLAVMARAIGLVAHIQEEMEEPLAPEIWSRVEEESSSHIRPGTD